MLVLGIIDAVAHAERFRQRAGVVFNGAEKLVPQRDHGRIIFSFDRVGAVVVAVQLGAHEDAVEPAGPDVHVEMRNKPLEAGQNGGGER